MVFGRVYGYMAHWMIFCCLLCTNYAAYKTYKWQTFRLEGNL